MTFVIVGAGATGVELAGTIAELTRATLPADFRNIDTRKARIALIEAGPRVLAGFADDLSDYARRSLERLGVEVMLGEPVTECTAAPASGGCGLDPVRSPGFLPSMRSARCAARRPRDLPLMRRLERAGPRSDRGQAWCSG